MAKRRQGARPSSSEVQIVLNNRRTVEIKGVLDRLAAERSFVEIQTKIDIGHLYLAVKNLHKPIGESISDLIEEHSFNENGKHVGLTPGSDRERQFSRRYEQLMELGEYTLSFRPIKLSSLLVKRRNDQGEREDEIFEFSPDELMKMEGIILIDDES